MGLGQKVLKVYNDSKVFELDMKKSSKLFTLIPSQWGLFANALSNISQAIILFSLAGMFVPQTVNLGKNFPFLLGLTYFVAGLIMLLFSGILIKKGK